jgi:hypothetical protein
MASEPGLATRDAGPGAMSDHGADSVSLTIPVEGFENVARLVAAGLASRLAFGFETVDDLQLALELVLRSLPGRGGFATVSFVVDDGSLSIGVDPVDGLALEQPLRALDGAGIDLGSSLERLVDAVEIRDGEGTEGGDLLLLRKRLPAPV